MNPTRVKICGLTRRQDVELCVELGAWAVGFIFHPQSRRQVTLEAARRLGEGLPPSVERVGLFGTCAVSLLLEAIDAAALTAVQCHDGASSATIQAIPVPVIARWVNSPVESGRHPPLAYLVDAPGSVGGQGKSADWNQAKEISERHSLILAGGLRPDNVARAIQQVSPWAVDVCSGVEESVGVKSSIKLKHFFTEVGVRPATGGLR